MSEKIAKRRVKLYTLNADRQWDDRGTGHVLAIAQERPKAVYLLVKAEMDGATLLESKILADTAYQRQQGTLIVWSEGDSYDLALSFQERAGCEEIWAKICQVQGKDPSLDITQELAEENEDDRYDETAENTVVELPECDLSTLEEINETVNSCMTSQVRKEKLAFIIETEGFIKKLISIFHTCEDVGNMKGLHNLYEIFKHIFHLNKNSLFEMMFSEDMIFHIVGALEYDPNCTFPKRHRQYLKNVAIFKEVIPIDNKELLSKIHQTYRVQYIQDVVLPTPQVFEENILSTLSTFIFFNKVEIVNIILEDEKLLTDLFNQLNTAEDDLPIERRRQLVLFLKEFCTFSQTLQPVAKENFLKTLSALGVLPAVEISLCLDDTVTKSAAIDILTFIVEFSPSIVREYMLQQLTRVDEEQYLINVIIEQMVLDIDPEMGGAIQLNAIIRILIDPENMITNAAKSERTDFLSFLYKHSMHFLVAPLLSNTVGNELLKNDYQTAQLLALILELLTFCVEHHLYHIKYYIVQRELLKRILVVLQGQHTFLVLGALRFMRRIIGLKDDFYNRHIINGKLFGPVIEALQRNNGRYNLLDSAIIEMFQFIASEQVINLFMHIIDCYDPILSKVKYVTTFSEMRMLYDSVKSGTFEEKQKEQGLPDVIKASNGPVSVVALDTARFRRDVRDMDPEEEEWINSEEDVNMDDIEDKPATQLPISREISRVNMEFPDLPRKTPLLDVSPSVECPKSPPIECPKSPPIECQMSPIECDKKAPHVESDRMSPNDCTVTPIECDRISPTDILMDAEFSVKNDSEFTVSNKENHVACNLNEMTENCKPTILISKKVSLVDYDENSDDDEEIVDEAGKELNEIDIGNPSPCKRPRLEVD